MNQDPIKLLIADDDQADRITYDRFFKSEKLPYCVSMAGSVAEAKELVGSETFDLAVLDHDLGDGTAFDIVDELADTPFMLLTGVGNEDIAIKALQAGASNYLTKDFDQKYLNLLPIAIEKILHHKKTEQKVQNLEQEITSLQNIAGLKTTSVTAESYGLVSLKKGSPDRFNQIVKQYLEILELAVDERMYRVDHQLSERLRMMAEELGFMKCDPTDLIDLHCCVYNKKKMEISGKKEGLYTDEARILLIRLMGEIIKYYRNRTFILSRHGESDE